MTRAVFQLQNPDNGASATTPADVTVTGEIDVTNVDEFTRSVLSTPGPRPVILQLSAVKYLDSAGFAALDRLLEENAIVIVLSPDSFMYRVAELMCLPIHHDAETARRALRNRTRARPLRWPRRAPSRMRLWWLLANRWPAAMTTATGQSMSSKAANAARPP